MLKTTILAAAAVMAFGVTSAYASHDGGHDRGTRGGHHQKYSGASHEAHYRGHRHGRHNRHDWRHWDRYGSSWFDHRGRRHCRTVPRKVSIKAWDRRGNPYHKWVWKDVRVCA
ncbi:hypothetical protein [Methyloceanibacter sp.]|uniref:hypothetical protein n=1 Tax=Methyloceanibacter sp. TaxID=1965321 RepID=UPI0020817B4A|nr:hypothetical protein [Methyloceanibacter sp.]GFO82969.1 MAG: hypothetical protein A49_25960 [Methyloceanibacter sp.]HML90913.1 hypothetical protein [Methyloceanibacter sp.]